MWGCSRAFGGLREFWGCFFLERPKKTGGEKRESERSSEVFVLFGMVFEGVLGCFQGLPPATTSVAEVKKPLENIPKPLQRKQTESAEAPLDLI